MSAERPDFTPQDVELQACLYADRNRTDSERRRDSLAGIRTSLVAHLDYGLDERARAGHPAPQKERRVPGQDPLPDGKSLYLRGDFPGPFDLDLLNNALLPAEETQSAMFHLLSKSGEEGTPKIVLNVRLLGLDQQPLAGGHITKLKVRVTDPVNPADGECNRKLINLDTSTLLRIDRLLHPDRTTPIRQVDYTTAPFGGPINA